MQIDAKAMTQLMSPIPQFRLKSSPIWHYSMVDLFGPIEVTNFANQRTKRKTWAVIITCLTTRAVWVYLSESYSTDHLLSVFKKHESRNGSPSEYFADLGKQIIGADRVLQDAVKNLNQNEIVKFASARNVKFKFGVPHFPEGQGAVERLIQEVKKNLKVLTHNKVLSFGELDTLLAEASYLVNCRPLQLNPVHGEDGYICANDILFGRSDKEPVAVSVDDTSLTRRAAMKERIIDEFWSKWNHGYLQSLAKYTKWKVRGRNCQPGDVILILDREHARGQYTIGIIDSVKVDPDNVVRKVTEKYKVRQKGDAAKYEPNVYKYLERNVRGLAMLVTVEERKNLESINLDDLRLPKIKDTEANETSKDDSNAAFEAVEDEKATQVNEVDVPEEENVEKEVNENLIQLHPSSTGRKRWLPSRFTK